MESNNKGLGGFLLGRRGRELAMVRGELIAGNERGVRVRRKRVKGFFFLGGGGSWRKGDVEEFRGVWVGFVARGIKK